MPSEFWTSCGTGMNGDKRAIESSPERPKADGGGQAGFVGR